MVAFGWFGLHSSERSSPPLRNLITVHTYCQLIFRRRSLVLVRRSLLRKESHRDIPCMESQYLTGFYK